jgi:hypothetical protein
MSRILAFGTFFVGLGFCGLGFAVDDLYFTRINIVEFNNQIAGQSAQGPSLIILGDVDTARSRVNGAAVASPFSLEITLTNQTGVNGPFMGVGFNDPAPTASRALTFKEMQDRCEKYALLAQTNSALKFRFSNLLNGFCTNSYCHIRYSNTTSVPPYLPQKFACSVATN